MLTPDITIMSVGTEITYGKLMVPDDGWEQFLNHKWNRDLVTVETSKFPELTLQVHFLFCFVFFACFFAFFFFFFAFFVCVCCVFFLG